MKVSGPVLPPPAVAAPSGSGGAKSLERGQFQNLIQRLEHDMWSGADAGQSAAASAAKPAVRVRGPAAMPAMLTPASTLRDPDAAPESEPVVPQHYDLRDIVAAQAPSATPVANVRSASSEVFTAFVPTLAPRARNAAATVAEPEAARGPASASQPTQRSYEAVADRLSLINGAGGLSVAVRLREDRPLDTDLLKRTIARVLHEHGAASAHLYINGTPFDGGERHGD
ncbi:MAG: hypothetical protein ACREP7_09515 [Lysobacter sp.]